LLRLAAPVKRLVLIALLLCGMMLVCPRRVSAAQNSVARPAVQQNAAKPSPEVEEQYALDHAVRSAGGNPQALIQNLEEFLARFPSSPYREQLYRSIFRQALQANDPPKAEAYAEKLLELNPDDPALLSTVVDLLGRREDAPSRQRALYFATKFVAQAEKAGQATAPPGVPQDKWRETNSLMLASAYLTRGKIYAKSSKAENAFADYEMSYAAYPSAQVAELLGDLAAGKNDLNRAVNEYATAFAFPEKSSDPAHQAEIRRKLGSSYVAAHGTEKGLGDLVLARYDELMRLVGQRFRESHDANAELKDPFDFVLERPDGPPIRLTEYRGKVVVMEFWATWCGPCRLEGRFFERVRDKFRDDARAAFLAMNVDADPAGVPAFLKEEAWSTPVAYARGLDQLLGVRALPTLIIFDRHGRVVYRQEGMDPGSFLESIEQKVREALQPSTSGSPGSL
jgi:thiol-disulfide isomerase/thioredoxin